ncbi:MAG: TonB-dependent receptor [Pseudomonadota bacterium]
MTPLLCGNASAQETEASRVVQMPQITVFGAARDERGLLDTPNAVSVIGEEEIRRRQPSTYDELLGDLPGLTIEGGPRAISQEPNIRGFQDEQIVIRIDGARQNFNLAHRGRFFVDPSILKRVEVLRGGASTLYGSGALGGVIFLDTKDPVDVVPEGDIWGGQVKTGFNSQGSEFLGAGTLAARVEEFDALAFFAGRPMNAGLTDGSNEAIIGSEIDSLNGLLKLGWEPGDGHRIEGSFQFYSDDGITPPNANDQGEPDNLVNRDIRYSTARVAWDWAAPDNDLIDVRTLVYFNDVLVEEDRLFDGRFDETDYETLGLDVSNVSRMTLGNVPVAMSYGLEIFRDTQKARRDGQPRLQAPDAESRFFAGFVQADFEITPTVTITPGFRYDFFQLRPETTFEDRNESQPSPRLAMNWRPTDNLQFYASASRSFRAPTFTELYNDGVHFIVDSFPLAPGTVATGINDFVPTPDLEPERATQFEVGGRYNLESLLKTGDSLQFSGNAYYARVDDFVDTVVQIFDFNNATFNPITQTLEVNGTTTNRNVDARLFGFEGEVSYDSNAWFAGVGVTIPRGAQRDGAGELASIPQDRLVLTGGIRPTPDIELGVRGTFARGINEQDVPPESQTTPGFSVIDVFANWAPSEGMLRGAVFSAGIDNITDQTYRIHPNGLNSTGLAVKFAASLDF